jgi:teichuronic acid biosynthesis glycosyltransferase TuaG
MPKIPSLVSIVIPAYNADAFIEETIQSIYSQTYQNWEMIIINDGSTDKTAEITGRINDAKVKVINQQNAGVACARNRGMTEAKGEFIVFFDADDLMSRDFLATRVNALQKDLTVDYAGGLVQTFPVAANPKKAAASDPVNEILFFNTAFVTVPSNYIFRKKMLISNGITFNKELSSSADRFFIIEVSKVAKGKNIASENGKLLYRVTSQSMSNNVTPGLIIDNEKFYYELKRKNLLPYGKKQKFKSFYFLSLAKGFGLVKYWKRVFKYLVMSFINDPVFFTKNFGKSIITFPYFKGLRMNG